MPAIPPTRESRSSARERRPSAERAPRSGELDYSEFKSALDGSLAADLGFVPDFADAVPLRVPAGTVLRGAPVDVNILGEIPAGIDTGDLQITLLSDANGYLIPNPFSTEATAPRYALLRMDAAMTAEGTIANAALSQNLLNIQVVGLAIVVGIRADHHIVVAVAVHIAGR